MTETIFVYMNTVSVWHTLTMRVHEYLCAGVQVYRRVQKCTEVEGYMDAYENTCICGS